MEGLGLVSRDLFKQAIKLARKINPVVRPMRTVAIIIRGPSTCGFGISSDVGR